METIQKIIPWDFGSNAQYPVIKGLDANGDGNVDKSDLENQRSAFPKR